MDKTRATIKVEFDGGCSIDNAFTESIRLAKLLNCWIEFKFNDITCICNNESELQECIEHFDAAIKHKSKFAIA